MVSLPVPGAVTNLTFANVNTTAVRLSWFNPEDQQPYYEYKIQTTNYTMSGATLVEPPQLNINTSIVTGLQPGTGYCFNVTVVVPGRESAVEHELGYTCEYFWMLSAEETLNLHPFTFLAYSISSHIDYFTFFAFILIYLSKPCKTTLILNPM